MSGKYQTYPEYKDSGVRWLGSIPANWQVKRVKHLTTLNPSKSEVRSRSKDEHVSFIPMEAIGEQGELDASGSRLLGEVLSGYTYVADGDVMLAKITPCFENGKAAVATGLQQGIGFATTEVIPVRPNDPEDAKFFYYLLTSMPFKAVAEGSMYGAGGQKRVADSFVAEYHLAAPPSLERTQIAAFLDHETARIDRLIEKQQRLIELLKEKRQAVISHAVTKGLDPNVPMKDSGVEWLGQVPEHWCVTSIRNLVRSGNLEVQDGNHGELHPVANEYVDVGIPFLMANNIRDGKIDTNRCKRITKERADQLRIGFSVAGDMLLTHKGTVGEVAKVPEQIDEPYWMLTPQVTYYRWSPRFYDSSYFTYQFQSKAIATQLDIISAMQSTRSYVGLIAQGALIVTVPPIREQMQIQKELFRRTNKFNGLLSKASLMVKFLQERRTALISAAVTGKIDVRNWQPNTSTQVAESDLPMAAEQAAEAAPAHPCAHGTGSSMNSVTR